MLTLLINLYCPKAYHRPDHSTHIAEYNRNCRGSSGSIVSDYGLDDQEIEVRSPTGAENFSSSP
jgi:hypothetical protein